MNIKKTLRNKIFILLIFLFTSNAFTDDTIYGILGKSIVAVDVEKPDIELSEENVTLTLYPNYFEINVDFIFFNEGEEQTLIVGFPVTYGIMQAKLYDFKVWINDEAVKREFNPIEQDKDGTPLIHIPATKDSKEWWTYKSDFAYKFPVTFKHGITTTKINYKNIYRLGPDMTSDDLYYYYGTASKWKNDLKKIELMVINKSPYSIFSENISYRIEDYKRTILSSDSYKITMLNIEPVWFDSFEWNIRSINKAIEEFYNEAEKIEQSDFDYTRSELGSLADYSKAQLRIIRNAVYALHGYNFKSKDLQELFSMTSWYKPNHNYSDSLLTEKQKDFIKLIQQEEAKRQ